MTILIAQKKPVQIEAMRWDGSVQIADAIEAWSKGATSCRLVEGFQLRIFICTSEGKMRADPDDYIIKGVKGEFYPCKPDVFDATYTVLDSK